MKHRLELFVGYLLRAGVLISGGLLAIGWILMWVNGSDISGNFRDYNPSTLVETLQWSLIMQDRGLLVSLVGLIFLVCLPVGRVLVTAVLFAWQKEYRLALVAFGVFILLVSSFSLGIDL